MSETIEISGGSAPDPVVANKFALTISNSDFAIAAGAQRLIFAPDGKVAGQVVEYSTMLVVSPVAAKQLSLMLQSSVAQYEKTFGAIPVDETSLTIIEDKALKAKRSKGASDVVSRPSRTRNSAKPSTKS